MPQGSRSPTGRKSAASDQRGSISYNFSLSDPCRMKKPSAPPACPSSPMQVDPNLDVVKGRGGALLREKMVEMASTTNSCVLLACIWRK